MERLFAPWRMKFIEELRAKSGTCFFCEANLASDNNKENLLLHRGSHCLVMLNRYPYTSGHVMVAPRRHGGSLSRLSMEENAEMMKLAARSVEILGETLHAEGFNCGFNLGKLAGAGIDDHIHMHIVPRWLGDTNFLPIVGDTRCISEYLEETYDRLASANWSAKE